MTSRQWTQVIGLAWDKRLCGVCVDGLAAAQRAFGATWSPVVLLSLRAGQSRDAVPVSHLTGSNWRWMLADLQALPGWRPRLRLIGEHLFPSVAYMRSRFQTSCR